MGTSQLALFDVDPLPPESDSPPPETSSAAHDGGGGGGERPLKAPVFWVEEIRLLKTLSPKPRQEIRRIELRRGLNIIWAPPLERDDPSLPFSGHAAGKTSFCRLMRYVLGEPKCGSPFLLERLHARLPKAWVVARVWVGDSPWVVARPLTGRRRSVCAPTGDLDAWLREGPGTSDDFEVFRVTLHQAVMENLPVKSFGESGQSIRLLHILAWLSRDQECRLNSLLAWRHADSQSGSPPLSAGDRRFLVRTLIGMTDQDIRQEMEHRVSLEEDLRRLPAEMNFRQRTVQEAIEELRPFMRETHANLADPLFASGVERQLNREEAEALSALHPDGEPSAAERRQTLDHALQDLGTARAAIQLWQTEPCGVEGDLARKHCPFHVDSPDPLPPQGALVTRNRLRESTRAVTEATARVEERRAAYEEALASEEKRRGQADRVRSHYQGIRQQLERAVAAQTTLDALTDMRENLISEIEASQLRQESLQRRRDREASRFSAIYRGTMKRLLGRESGAECRFTRENIRLQASSHGDLNSAAINTLITLGFDLAALLGGVRGLGHHPRFLVHDSPREADMDAHLYRRLFTYVHSLEPRDGPAAFQYIITSTESPPETLCREPWLRLQLNASRPEDRLFCEDL